MSLQVFGNAALSVLIVLAVQPLSSQEGGYKQGERAQKLSERASRTLEGAKKDHLCLAAYFGELASQERELADSYSRLAAIYNDKTPPPGTDDASAREMAIHYRRVAEAAKKAAAAVESVSAYHSRVAEQVGDTPVPNSNRGATHSFSALGK